MRFRFDTTAERTGGWSNSPSGNDGLADEAGSLRETSGRTNHGASTSGGRGGTGSRDDGLVSPGTSAGGGTGADGAGGDGGRHGEHRATDGRRGVYASSRMALQIPPHQFSPGFGTDRW